MEHRKAALLTAVLASLALSAGTASAESTTWWVDANGTPPGTGTSSNPFTSIHYAVHQAEVVDGDLILVRPGIYEETVEIVDKYVTVRSTEGPEKTVVDAYTKNGPVFTVVGSAGSDVPLTVTIQGFTITGGKGTKKDGVKTGGGILLLDVEAYVLDCLVLDNTAVRGAGMAVLGSYAHVADTEFIENMAETEPGARDGQGGGIFSYALGGVSLHDALLRGNVAGIGGGIYSSGTQVELYDTQVLGNKAWGESYLGEPAQGGGIYAISSGVVIENSRIGENLAWGPNTLGGGLRFCEGTEAQVLETLVDQNAVGDWKVNERTWQAWGGGIASGLGLEFRDGEIVGNYSTYAGGGIYGYGDYDGVLFKENWAHRGGAIFTELPEDCFFGMLTLKNSSIQDNLAYAGELPGEGGGIAGPAFVEDCEIFDNLAYGDGGGTAGATLFDCKLYGNRIEPVFPGGPPVWGAGAFQGYLNGCMVHDNVAAGVGDIRAYGGGVANASVILTQIFDNEAVLGGGAANCELDRVTVSANKATHDAGGLYFDEKHYVTSSIVWKNRMQNVVDLYGITIDYSNIGPVGWTGAGVGNGNMDPLFWNFDARDFHLKPLSPCIDTGDPLGQDPDGSRCDQGALWFLGGYCGMPMTYCQAELNSRGCLPAIGYVGTPSLTGSDDFHVTAANLPNQTVGLMLWSFESASEPLFGGTLCVQKPLTRTPVENTGGSPARKKDCTGTLAFHLTQSYMSDNFLWHGRTIYTQFVFRDRDLDHPGMTEGLRVTICP